MHLNSRLAALTPNHLAGFAEVFFIVGEDDEIVKGCQGIAPREGTPGWRSLRLTAKGCILLLPRALRWGWHFSESRGRAWVVETSRVLLILGIRNLNNKVDAVMT